MNESETETSPNRKLMRSRDDRYIGGVAAGIAKRFHIDPALTRIAFVLTLAFGGIGAIAYLVLLVMLPIEGDPDEEVPPVPEGRRIAVIVGTVVIGFAFLITRGSGGWLFGIGPGPLFGIVFWALAIAGLVWLIREGTRSNPPDSFTDQPSTSAAPSPSQTAPTRVMPADKTPATGTTETKVAGATPSSPTETLEEQQERSGGAAVGKIMTWFAIGIAALLGLSIVAGISAWVTVIAGTIPMAIIVSGLGIAMVVLAIFGQRTIAIWLLPVALFVAVPMAVLSLAGIRLEGSYGDLSEKPVTQAEIPSKGFQLAAGQMKIDMRGFDFQPGSTVELPVDSGLGYTQIIVPDEVCVTADIDGKAGLAEIRGTRSSGVDITRKIASRGNGAPGLHVDADFQLGFLQVIDSTAYRTHNYLGNSDYDKYNGGGQDDWAKQDDEEAVARAKAACEAPAPAVGTARPPEKSPVSAPGEATKS